MLLVYFLNVPTYSGFDRFVKNNSIPRLRNNACETGAVKKVLKSYLFFKMQSFWFKTKLFNHLIVSQLRSEI